MTAERPLLRPYQEEALATIAQRAEEDVQRQIVALPTGTGKTVVFSELLARRPGRALVLVHRDELVSQTLDKLAAAGMDHGVGVVKAERDDTHAEQIVASVQTLSRQRRLARLGLPFQTVIVDEAHHANADTYQRVLEHVGSFHADGPLTVGFTATPERGDGRPLGEVWQEIVFRRDLLTMMQAGYLCDLRGIAVRVNVDFDGLHTRMGDYVPGELDDALEEANAPTVVAQAYRQYAARRRGIVFTVSVAAAHDTAAALVAEGFAAEAVDGETPQELRRAILSRLASGETQVVCNCGVLTEGFDCPAVDCIVMARPTKSRPLYMQMVGRGTRIFPGKDDCLVIDLVGLSETYGLVTLANLFGLWRKELGESGVLEAVAAKAAAEEERKRRQYEADLQRAADEAERAALLAAERERRRQLTAREIDLFKRHDLQWVVKDSGRYYLPLGGSNLAILPNADGETYRVLEVVRDERPVVLAEALALGYAQGRAEDLVRERRAAPLVDKQAPWRQGTPSERQLYTLRKAGVPNPEKLTKGEASDLLTAYFAERTLRQYGVPV